MLWVVKYFSRKGAKAQSAPRFFGALFAPLRLCGRNSVLVLSATFVIFLIYNSQRSVTANADETAALIDAALYTRHEFFGAQAIVPYPTAEARNRLAAVLEKYPNTPNILLKLSQLDEKLGREEEALREMQAYVEHEPDKQQALATMAEFFHRRAQFAAEAETFERQLAIAPADRRVEIFRKLIELSEKHLIDKYLTPRFFEQTLEQNPSAFEIVTQYQERLTNEGNYTAALNLIRRTKDRFPEHRAEMIQTEVSLLDDMGRTKEAESVYTQAFDPFWRTDLTENFYEFLKDHDRFRSYGHELRNAFRRNPTDVAAAVRLIHYSKYTGHDAPDVFVQLEKARAARKTVWKQDELITITRMLLANGYGEAASRFLYTLYLQGELKPGSTLRARVLYQLFELLSDAGDQRVSFTRGDLKFYEDIATADPHPGIFGGILSLILADTQPQEQFARQEAKAVKYFNRAAAYRIFMAYKQENPTAPELAQMYLDIVRLYSANKDVKVASETLAEFESRYADAPEYAEVALKLADCYIAVKNFDGERAAYGRILDYLGQHRVKGVALVSYSEQASNDQQNSKQALDLSSEPTTVKPHTVDYPPISNPGIEYPGESTNSDPYAQYSSTYAYADYLGSAQDKPDGSANKSSSVDYQTVLSRYVASFAKDNRTADILALYSGEIKKYPDEQGLYEQMLQWLGQTNLVDEQLRVYQQALRTFPSMTWHDRLARWYVRQKRTAEFETLSRELIAKVDDREAERYLEEFVQGSVNADPSSFDAKLYLALYSLAHQRFPRNLYFVSGLLKFYAAHKQWEPWRMLVAEYYFESQDVRNQFLSHLAGHDELRKYLARARETLNTTDTQALLPYKLFRADAAAWLSNYEEAIDGYRELNRLYPNSPEFAERLVSFTRSLGQHNPRFLEESATISKALADAAPSVAEYRTRSGEIQAELGDYNKARAEWEQLIPIAKGDEETYLNTATIYWDYFQYDEALRTIKTLRRQMDDPTLYSFQVAVILEDKHQLREAIPEYVKALGSDDEDTWDSSRARKRLVKLSKRPGVYQQIVAAFKLERNRNDDWGVVWEYTNFLNDSGRWPEASDVLRAEVDRSDSSAFLTRARDLFEGKEETDKQLAALNRLIATTNNQRSDITYRLQLAEVYSRKGQRAQAASVLHALVGKYNNNYGVLSESADFFWRLGQRSSATAILQSSMQRGIGRFHYLFGRKLAARQTEMQQYASAQQVLEKLNREDRMNVDVFRELANVYVRSGNQQGLRTTFGATIQALKKEDTDPRETREQIAQLRQEMIAAFTRLKDYASAVEQHIEIINRDPDDEQYVDAAINYVRRYGGGDTLLNYYQRTSQQAFKNYRWNVVLARIYDAQGDTANTVRQYRAAIVNQPEMIELYDSLADVYTRAKDYDSAVTALRQAQELSNDDPLHVKRTIAVLEKAGRHREAEVERRKLPLENVKPLSVSDQFAAASQLRNSDLKNSVEQYRKAYDGFVASPFNNELKPADIAGYVQTVRSEERLDEITKRLWELRQRIVSEAQTPDSKNAGKARSLLTTFDGAVAEAVGSVAADKATGEELTALFQFLHEQVNSSLRDGDSETLAFMRNLSRRAGFGSIDEEVLKSLKDRAYSQRDWSAYHNHLKALVDLYDSCGAYRQILDLLQAERARNAQPDGFDYVGLIASNARLLGDTSLELQALREHYQKPADQNQLAIATDSLVDRYFEALWESGAAGRSELLSCAQHPTSHQLQLITFLLTKDDKELVHVAIESSPLSAAWKSSRNAEVSLRFGEFESNSENYFIAALNFAPIGQLIQQKPDATQQLVGDDWYRLAQTYGRWLHSSPYAGQKLKSRALLTARMENRPEDVDAQAQLGRWYLERKDLDPAIQHLALAYDSQPENKKIFADLGSAYFLRGDRQKANQLWEKMLEGEAGIDDNRLYLETLIKHNLNEQARNRLMPIVITRLKEDFRDEDDNVYSPQTRTEDFKSFLRVLAKSFTNSEPAKAKFFAAVCAAVPNNRFLPAFLVRESLVSQQELGRFYKIMIERSKGFSSYDSDYSYTFLLERNFDDLDAESAVDQESDYKPTEPENSRIKWQKEYLEYLIKQRQDAEARRLIASIERDLQRRYARPIWLRLASIRLDVRAGRVAQAVDHLEWVVGIKTPISVDSVKPPGIERLNDTVALLVDEGRETEARNLLETTYARGIALGNFEPVYFAGLARVAFERGDKSLALMWLRTMVDLTAPESKEETVAALMAMPLITARNTESTSQSEYVQFDQTTALRLASETAGEFGAYDAAIDFRQRLMTASPTDDENRIELVRLLAAGGKRNEAIQNLAGTIADRNATRTLRWQAVWLTQEIAANDLSFWANVRERVRALNASDTEMNTSLEVLSLTAAGKTDDALKVIAAAESSMPNEYLSSLHGIVEKKNSSADAALNSFTRVLIASQQATAAKSFGFFEDEPLEQIVALYLKQNQPRAALKVAERVVAFQTNKDPVEQSAEPKIDIQSSLERYQTLRERAAQRERVSHANILAMLSTAAEQLGDLNRALEFERLRLPLVIVSERKGTQARLDHLQQLQAAAARTRKASLVIDQKLAADNTD